MRGDIMITTIKRILLVINQAEEIEALLRKVHHFFSQKEIVLEVLYVYERPLFEIPDYFLSQVDDVIDKEIVKKHIQQKIKASSFMGNYAIFVYIDDTVDRVIRHTRSDDHTLIMIAYHDELSERLVEHTKSALYVSKDIDVRFSEVIVPIDMTYDTLPCIDMIKSLFPTSNIKLLHDARFTTLLGEDEKEKEAFERLKKKSALEGEWIEESPISEVEFVEELYTIEKHLARFINERGVDVTVLCSFDEKYLFSDSISTAMLEMVEKDLLLLR